MISRLVSSVRTSSRESVRVCVHAHSVVTLTSSVAEVWRQPLVEIATRQLTEISASRLSIGLGLLVEGLMAGRNLRLDLLCALVVLVEVPEPLEDVEDEADATEPRQHGSRRRVQADSRGDALRGEDRDHVVRYVDAEGRQAT